MPMRKSIMVLPKFTEMNIMNKLHGFKISFHINKLIFEILFSKIYFEKVRNIRLLIWIPQSPVVLAVGQTKARSFIHLSFVRLLFPGSWMEGGAASPVLLQEAALQNISLLHAIFHDL